MLTGARKSEVGGMRWEELATGLWTLPARRAKNGREHEVPLSRQAQQLIAALPRTGPWLFGRRGKSPFSGWSRCKERLDAGSTAARLAPWTLHDLRRSVATHMAEQEIAQPHIIEAILGHVSGHKAGVAGIYNRAAYRAEKAAALQRWADWLEGWRRRRRPRPDRADCGRAFPALCGSPHGSQLAQSVG